MKTSDLNTGRVAPDASEGVTTPEQGQDVSALTAETLLTSSSFTKAGNGPTLEAFNAALKLFEDYTVSGMVAARACAEMAVTHFCLHGDTTYMVRFLMSARTKGKNYVRQAALQKWYLDFFPVEIETKESDVKITKSKIREAAMWPDEVAKQTLLEKAVSIPFWEHSPDKEIVRFGKLDLLLAIKKTVESFGNEKKYVAGSNQALEAQKAALQWIDSQLN